MGNSTKLGARLLERTRPLCVQLNSMSGIKTAPWLTTGRLVAFEILDHGRPDGEQGNGSGGLLNEAIRTRKPLASYRSSVALVAADDW